MAGFCGSVWLAWVTYFRHTGVWGGGLGGIEVVEVGAGVTGLTRLKV